MNLLIDRDKAYCGRPGCFRLIGHVIEDIGHVVVLDHGPREGWVAVEHPDGSRIDPLWMLRRRRRPNPREGEPSVQTGAAASNGEIVECPRCKSRNTVPELSR